MMRSASYQPIDHVSVSPTDGIGSTQGQRKTLTRVGIMNPRPSGLITAAPPTELQGQTVITVASRKFFRFPKINKFLKLVPFFQNTPVIRNFPFHL